ncbi:chain length determinant protein [Streptomyces sp. NBC_01190]|uniref:chain length determinant protein n=1 Tax=Streptomyces sp. NBC_01190 TaxID=2903767 RepID=UPI003866C0D7|nr:chain length determinant protein [Streptomyces sp. NBC_01190]
MDLAEICRVMGRRWYVLVPGLLLTAVLVAGVYTAVPVTYQSQSTVMLLNSELATRDFDGNPFLSTQTSLTGMADSLARNLNSDTSVSDLRKQGATGTPAAKIADNALGPLMWLTATGTDPAAVLRTDRVLTQYAAKRLQVLQDQQAVKPAAMIRMTTIVPPQIPIAQTKTRTEYLAMGALLGLVVSLVATFYVEARFRGAGTGGRRRAGARGSAPEPPSAAAGSGGAPGEPAESAERAARPAPRWSAATGTPDSDAAEPADPAEPADDLAEESPTPRYV